MKIRWILFVSLVFVSQLSVYSQQDTSVVFSSEKEAKEKMENFLEIAGQNRVKDIRKSVEFSEKALKIAQKIENYEYLYRAEFLLGFAHYNQNNFEKSLLHFGNSLKYSRLSENAEGEAAALNRLGNSYQLMGKFNKALELYKEAMQINRTLNDKLEIARTLTNLGSIYRLFGNYELAINQHLEALDTYEGLQNNEGIAWSALNIARLFKMMKNYSKSIEYIHQSLEIYELIEGEGATNTGVTLCLKELGSVYYEMGDSQKAIEYSEKVLERNKITGNQQGIANSLSTLGQIYFYREEPAKSLSFFLEAKELKDSLNDKTEMSLILRYLGRIYLLKGNIPKAGEYLQESLEYAQKQNLKEEIKEDYLALSELCEKRNQLQLAFGYYKQYTALKDSLNSQKINELELQYEFDKQQREAEFEQKQKDALQQAKLQKQKIYTWAFVGGFLFMIVFAYVIFKNYQRKKRTNIILTRQKEEIEAQKDEIEAQRDYVTKQRDQIAHQNTIITDSIEYASRIQAALFPQQKKLQELLPAHFIFMKPKNIVSGDFYWITEKGKKLIVVVSDCTGHGVPGAFMSMLGIAFLSEIVNKSRVIQPNKILDELRERIIESLHQDYGSRGSKDGMDMAICIIDKESLLMEYAGAYNPVFIVRNKELIELKADKMPIGIHAVKVEKGFSKQEFTLEKNDMVYMFSDGYMDQFGGAEGLKFKQKSFKELLTKIADKKEDAQLKKIEKTMKDWQGDFSQIDDIMVLGFRI